MQAFVAFSRVAMRGSVVQGAAVESAMLVGGSDAEKQGRRRGSRGGRFWGQAKEEGEKKERARERGRVARMGSERADDWDEQFVRCICFLRNAACGLIDPFTRQGPSL